MTGCKVLGLGYGREGRDGYKVRGTRCNADLAKSFPSFTSSSHIFLTFHPATYPAIAHFHVHPSDHSCAYDTLMTTPSTPAVEGTSSSTWRRGPAHRTPTPHHRTGDPRSRSLVPLSMAATTSAAQIIGWCLGSGTIRAPGRGIVVVRLDQAAQIRIR